jgi:glycosyltransferase involved in cell wall biosynthesis
MIASPSKEYTMPRLSVLLPCFNAAEHLSSCLESLFRQSYEDFEVLAVDDGSEDDTPQLLEEAAHQDRRVRLASQSHCGIAETLRVMTEVARGSFVARMDADDIAHPERFALQVKFLDEHPEFDVVGSRVRLFPREQLSDGLLRYESWTNGVITHEEMLRDLFIESPLPHPSVMMRKATLDRVGGYRDAGWPEDYDLWMRMAHEGCRFAKIPEVLLEWRDRPDRASRKDPRFSAESFMALKEHYLMKTYFAAPRCVGIWGTGPIGKGWARRLQKRGVDVEYFIDLDPRKIGKRIHGASVIAASELQRVRGVFLLVAVGALSRQRTQGDPWLPARVEIRAQLAQAGFVDGRDFVCVA